MAFKECNDTIEETKEQTTVPTKVITIPVIVGIIVITVVVIAVIVGVILVLRRTKDKPKTITQSGISHTTKTSSPQYPKGSYTDDIDRYHNRFIQSKPESTAATKTSVNSGTEDKGIAKVKPLVETSDNKGSKSVSPSKKVNQR